MNIGKINNSILKEEEYKKIINNLIDRYLNTKKTIDIRLLWDALKVEIREITSVYCKNKAKSTREKNSTKFIKSVPIKIKYILLACDLSFLLHVYCCIFPFKYRQMSTSLFDIIIYNLYSGLYLCTKL
jgi:hypothetical protein